ncbi:MAG TPA: type II toxin-antitoxin system VapC family toxin, partial [Thauera aminoaromatica]|nr:type II toxin-antitoxin system VapC family toxin [Thauera aminoaromatica]
MIALDTNILVYAHRTDSPFHERARSAVETLASGVREWAIPWPCAHEFFAVETHPRIFKTA